MRIRLYVLLLSLAVSLWGSFAIAAPPAPLRLVSDVWPPFTDVEGKPREAIDLVKAALQRGGIAAKFSIMTWSTAEAELAGGKADGSAAMWKSPEREKYLLYSKPYLENRLLLVAKKGQNVAYRSVGELTGKRLAVTKGYAYGDAVLRQPNVTLIVRDSDADCLKAVLSGDADYLLLDALLVHHLFEFYAKKAGALIVAGDIPVVRYPLYFAIRKDYPKAEEIIDAFNKNVGKMIADGTYNTILHVPWIRADIDGDGIPEYVGSSKTGKKSLPDPSANKLGYPIFYSEPGQPGMNRTPGYVIDGKSYNNWGDAASSLNRAGPTGGQGLYKYSTGVVLLQF
jgi:polar amino acid transport system substrate-binding protein